jgi:hypothetical protein
MAPWDAHKVDWNDLNDFEHGNGIALITLPRTVRDKIGSMISGIGTQELPPGFKEAVFDLCVFAKNPVFGGVACHTPNLPTVTIDRRNNCRIGLHIDSWDGHPISQRHLSTNRISINLGPESRRFLFSGPTIGGMVDRLVARGILLGKLINTGTVIDSYFREFADESIYGVDLPPGSAYIAPTENVVHDASTLGNRHSVTSVTWRGMISPRLS